MKNKLVRTCLLSLVLASISVNASVLYWSGDGSTLGGAGTWNTTSARWGTDTAGPFTSVWANANSDDAYLSGLTTTANNNRITLAAPVTMNGTLTWQQTPGTIFSYSIIGSSTMTFSPGSFISCDNSAGGSIGVGLFNCLYAGTITKVGAAQVEFNNANGNVTKFIMRQGTASFAAPSRFGSGADAPDFLTFDGGFMRPNTTTAWTMGKSITVTANGGTISSSSATITITLNKPITWTASATLRVAVSPLHLANTGNSGTGTLSIGTATTCDAANVIGSNTHLTVSSGSLNMTAGNQSVRSLSSSGSINLGTRILTLNNTSAQTYSGVISGTGGLVKNGTSTQTLSGNNTYSGATAVNVGTLVFSGASTCTGITTVNSNATLRLGATGGLSSSPIVVNGGGTLDVNSQSPTIAQLSGSGDVINNAYGTIAVNGNLSTGGGYANYSCYSGTLTNGGLYKSGTHAMALRGSNVFDGTVGTFLAFDNGTLSVGAAPDRLPPSTSLALNTPCLFQLDANSQAIASLNGNGSGGNVNLGGGTLTVNEAGGGGFYGIIQNSELPGSSTALGHGLRGYYYSNIDMTGLGSVRDDATLNLPGLSYLPGYTPDVTKTNNVSARWLGQVLTTASGDYKFTTICDDGSRLWVNGALLVDNWIGQAATNKSGTITLAANTKYDLIMEWFNGSSVGGAMLLWTPPTDTTTNIIPTEYLFLPGPGALVMGGTGSLTLGSANTYSGDTIVAAGTLYGQADSSLGQGNVRVSDANLVLQYGYNGYISPSASLLLNGTAKVGLNYDPGAGMQNVRGLSFDGGATYQPAGTYGSTSSTATHKDDAHFDASWAGVINVVGSPSSIGLTALPGTSVYGSPVTLTATVTPSGVTGAVTFYDGANWLGSAALNGLGVATLTVSNLQVTASPHSITAVYGGDATHAPRTSAAASATTTVATLTPHVVINNKVYDGTTTATISSATTFTGIYSGDTNYVHISGTAAANFVDKNVGVGKTVNITGMTLSGSLASNYQMPTTSTSVTADITAKPLTVTGLTANNKVYDSTTSATFTGTPALSGIVGSETVTLGGTPVATFDTENIGTNKTVTITGYTLGGADAGNYSLPATTLKANISTFPISVGGLAVVTKTYDGTNSASLSGLAVLSPAPFGGDVVTLDGTPIASFNNKNAGSGKAVTVIGYTISGADAANYSLSQPTGLTGTITTVPTSCVLVSSVNPSAVGQNVTFTATFTANPLPVVPDAPTGTASFTVNGIPVASPTVVSNAPGVATAVYSTSALAAGTSTILAAYITDNNYQASNNSLPQVVTNTTPLSAVTISNIVGTTLRYGGGGGSKFILIKSTAVNTPLSSWTYPGLTNTSTPGTFTIPAVGTGTPVFYRVLSQ